jgi:ABC-type branched-subunit amino acid transport system substrate-binding protein
MAAVAGVLALPAKYSDGMTLTVAMPDGVARSRVPLLDGVHMGLNESQRAATLFARDPLKLGALDDATVVVASVDGESFRTLVGECDRDRKILLNCGSHSNAFRREICSPYVFHVAASDAMYSDAQKHSAGGNVVLWASSLDKYGASQLNDRFKSFAGYPMDGAAWAGWFAVKVLWEAYLRTKSADTSAVAERIAAGEFDGHKGAQLSFRAWDHQLRQPLYALTSSGTEKGPIEIPGAGSAQATMHDQLDTLGDPASKTRCRMSRS